MCAASLVQCDPKSLSGAQKKQIHREIKELKLATYRDKDAGPAVDLSKQSPAALQMLAVGAATPAPRPSEAQATPAQALRAAVC